MERCLTGGSGSGSFSPGQEAKVTRAISEQFARASHDIFIIDRYVRVGTIRLLAWVPSVVAITVIGTRMDADVRQETARLRGHGRNIRLVEVQDQDIPHDRWFWVDGEWWHSGASLKDLGRRFSRISKVDSAENGAHDSMLEDLLRSGSWGS